MIRVAAWNLGHQIRERPIPDFMVDVIRDLDADTVLFNEYVDGGSRDAFKAAMCDAGFGFQAVSPTPARHNQIFAASKFAFEVGDIAPPQFDGSAISNFLHLWFPNHGCEMVGLRAPAYVRAAERHAYWAELAGIMGAVKDRPILFAGDVNYDPFGRAKLPDAASVPFHLCKGYEIPNPDGGWSYMSYGGGTSRIDHVIHTPGIAVRSIRYVDWIRGRCLAGEKAARPISDHAALWFEVGS